MNQHYKAYNRASHTVGKTRQVVMLYEGMIRFMQQAAEAIEKKDYETRYHKLTRVSEVLTGLQACLDFEAGGPSAQVLYHFYSATDRRVYALHRTNDIEECRKLIAELKQMRDTWDRIDRGGESAEAPAEAKPSADPADPMAVSA